MGAMILAVIKFFGGIKNIVIGGIVIAVIYIGNTAYNHYKDLISERDKYKNQYEDSVKSITSLQNQIELDQALSVLQIESYKKLLQDRENEKAPYDALLELPPATPPENHPLFGNSCNNTVPYAIVDAFNKLRESESTSRN